MAKKLTVCIDPGHGMGNKVRGKYDTGAVAGGHTEAAIVMTWANELRAMLRLLGHKVIRTRVDDNDPAPVSRRDDIAVAYGCDIMISLHCNFFNGKASGTEVFYRGGNDKAFALLLADSVSRWLGLSSRGAKTEKASQHSSLAVLDFDACWLIELGFIDNPVDRAALLDPKRRKSACEAIAQCITMTARV